MSKILKSRKGGIPAINEIVLTVLHTTPKPILFFIFILLTSVIAGVFMPIILGFAGYECAYKNNQLTLFQIPVQSAGTAVFQNINQAVLDATCSKPYEYTTSDYLNGNSDYLRVPDSCYNTVQFNGTSFSGYDSRCTNCSDTQNWVDRTFSPNKAQVCVGDGYSLVQDVWHVGGNLCYCQTCAPPQGYYFDPTACTTKAGCYFTEINKTSKTGSVLLTALEQQYYNSIVKLGGVERPQNSQEFVNIQCAAAGRPEIYVFSIRIFNPVLWIYLYLAYWILVFAGWYYKHLGIY
jgi:hypothetical protein